MTAEGTAAARESAPPAGGAATRAADGDLAEPSNTAAVLRGLLAGLLVLTLAAAATSLVVLVQVHATIAAVREHAPAVQQTYAAEQDLADADTVATQAVSSRTRLLGGPGNQYEDDIAAANASLSLVAADNAAGAAGSGQVELVQGLVATYAGLVEQADNAGAASSGSVGALAVLADASSFMNPAAATRPCSASATDGLLGSVNTLCRQQTAALAALQSSAWVDPAMCLLWLVVCLVLAAALVVADLAISRRFRRTFTLPLAGAAVALIGLAVVSGLTLTADSRLDAAANGPGSPLAATTSLYGQQTAHVAAADQAGMAQRIATACGTGCGTAVTALEARLPQTPALPDFADRSDTAWNAYVDGLSAADFGYAWRIAGVAVFTVLLAGLVFAGFQPRLEEYRFRR